MRNKLITLAIIVVSFLLQCTLMKGIAIGSISPNLLVVLCVSIGLMRGKTSGLFTGFLTGLFIDLFYGYYPGIHAGIYMYVGFLSGFFYQVYYDDDVKVPMLLAAGGDFFYNFMVFVFLFLLQVNINFLYYLRRVILPEMIYTLVLTALVYRLYYKIIHRFMRVNFKESDSLWLTK